MKNSESSTRRRRRRLSLQRLDARRVLAAFLWNTDSDGLWSDAANWQVVEGSSSTGVPASGDTVTIDRPNAEPVVTISSATTVDEVLTSETLAVEANFNVNRTLSVAGTVHWTGGNFFTAGGVTIDPDGRFEIGGTPGQFTSNLSNAGTVDQTASFNPGFNRILIDNLATGTWITPVDLASSFGSGIFFENRGSFEKTGDGDVAFANAFDNFTHFEGSRVVVVGGKLSLPTSGTQLETSTGATFDVATGATLDWLQGIGYFSGTYTGTGGGRVELSQGDFNVGFSPAVFDFPEQMLHWTGGGIRASRETLENRGFMHWSGDGSRDLQGTQFLNAGNLIHEDSGESLLNSGGQGTFLQNGPSGVFELQDSGSLTGGTLVNAGLIRKTGQTTDFDVRLFAEPNSRVQTESGTLRLTRGGSFATSTFDVAADAEVVLDASTSSPVQLRDGAVLSGTGQGDVLFQDGRIDSVANNASIDFAPGLFQWSGGEFFRNIGNLGQVTVIASDVPHGPVPKLNGDFVNAGDVVQTAGAVFEVSGNIINEAEASWELIDDASLRGPGFIIPTFQNSGLLLKTGAGTSLIQENGVALVHQGGTIRIDEGVLQANHSSSFTSSGASFEVAAQASFVVTGTFMSSGTYTGSGSGKVIVEARLRGEGRDFTLDFPDGLLTLSTTNLNQNGGTIINDGFLRLEGPDDLHFISTLVNNGTITQAPGMLVQLRNFSQTINYGDWIVEGDGVIELVQFSGLAASFYNFGEFDKRGEGILRITSTGRNPRWINASTMRVVEGSLELDARLLGNVNVSDATLQTGIWEVADSATLKMFQAVDGEPDQPIEVNSAEIRLLGPQARFDSLNSLRLNSGVIEIRGSRQFDLPGDVQNGELGHRVTPRSLINAFSGRLVGVASNPNDGTLIIHGRNERDSSGRQIFRRFVETGIGQQDGTAVTMPGSILLTTGLDVITTDLNLGGTTVPAGAMLFAGLGEGDDSEVPVIYAVDVSDGSVLASQPIPETNRDHIGVAHHPERGSVFLLGGDGQIREIDPADGSVSNTFPVTPPGAPFYSVNFGGLDVVESTGELIVAAGSNGRLRMLSPTGDFLRDVDLNLSGANPGTLSDVSVNNQTGEILISGESGRIFRLSPIVGATIGTLRLDGNVKVNVAGDFTNEGTVQLSVGGQPTTGDFASIVAGGEVTLDGELQIYASTTLASEVGDSYRLIAGDSLAGDFDSLIAPDFETITDEQAVFAFFQRAPKVDLIPTSISGPAEVIAGEMVEVEWTVSNFGSDPAIGPWFDEFRLQSDEITNASGIVIQPSAETLVGGVRVGEGVELAPGESIAFDAMLRVPGLLPGDYRWLVETNRQSDVLEAEGKINNELIDDVTTTVDLTELSVDGPAASAVFGGADQPNWYKVSVVGGASVGLDLIVTADDGVDLSAVVNEVYVAREAIPDRVDFDAAQQERGAANVSLAVTPQPVESFVYITAFPASFDEQFSDFSIRAVTLPADVESVTPANLGNDGSVTVTVAGDRLATDLEYRLVRDGSPTLTPVSMQQTDPSEVTLAFDFDAVAEGQYRLEALRNDDVVTQLDDAVTIESNRIEEIRIDVLGSSRVRSGRTIRYTVNYANDSNIDRTLPFITAEISGGGTLKPSIGSVSSERLVMLAPPVVLGSSKIPAGGQGQLTFFYNVPLDEGEFEISVWADSIDDPEFAATVLPWDQYAVTLRPETALDEGWNQFIADERLRYGETFESLFEFLDNQIRDFGEDGFSDILFVNGEWQFEVPELSAGPTKLRAFVDQSSSERTPSLPSVSAATGASLVENFAEGESNGDGVQQVYAVIVGNPTGDLPGSEFDAESWANFATGTLNIPDESERKPRVFVNTPSSEKGNVESKDFFDDLDTANALLDDDDLLIVVYAGHGEKCEFSDDGGVDPGSGRLRFSDRGVTASELNERLSGSTRTLAVFDSCFSGALTAQMSAPNLTTISSTDFSQSAADSPSFSSRFVPAINKNKATTIDKLVEQASRSQQDKLIEANELSSSRVDRYKTVRNALHGSGLIRDVSINEAAAKLQSLGERAEGQDANGDGVVDSFLVDVNADGKPEARIPDYNGDGELSRLDFIPDAKPGRLGQTVDVDALTPAQQGQFQVFEQYDQVRKGAREYSRLGLHEPVVRGKFDGLSIDQIDSKGNGGATTTVGDDQTKRPPTKTTRGERGRSFDPNEKVGPAGFGPQGFLQNGMRLPYAIFFENDPEQATLPAQEVRISEVLDDDLDLTTFQLGDMMVGDRLIEVPSNRTAWSTRIFLEDSQFPLELVIEAELDFPTRTVEWYFATIDYTTGLLTEEFDAGFLPVNDETGRGEGQVNYSVRPKSDLATGTELTGSAAIVFDVNDPLITNSTLNTIDVDSPVATVNELPANSLPSFEVSWIGDDGVGSGVATYDVFVSTDDGPLEPWLNDVFSTRRMFRGAIGSSYSFVATGTDNVGLQEPASIQIESTTTVVAGPWTNASNRFDVNGRDGVTANDALLVINELQRNTFSDPETSALPSSTPDGFVGPWFDVNQDGHATALDALQVINSIFRESLLNAAERELPAAMPFYQATAISVTVESESQETTAVEGIELQGTPAVRTPVEVSSAGNVWDQAVLDFVSDPIEGKSDAELDLTDLSAALALTF